MDNRVNRRSFIKKTILAIVSLEIGYLFFDTFRSKTTKNDKLLFNAGKTNAFEKNKMYPFHSVKFYLSVLEDGGILALSIKCTHLGCIVQADEKGFLCPCHASAFNKRGEVLSPPAVRALDIFPIKIKNGEILVDIHHPIKRQAFDKTQITYA